MGNRPNDRIDLLLAPVALEIDARLQALGEMDAEALSFRVALEGNIDLSDASKIHEGVIEASTNGINLHHWLASIDPRGLRLSHEEHTLVLGLPENMRELLGQAQTP
ncbi:MAG: hypothetical protein K9G69_07845 [Candidatus Nanopelagicales bacterium]|nr:hypothetical protein [Candidatus Nanopelagicales bacterium]